MKIEIPKRHQMCCVCLEPLDDDNVRHYIENGIALLACENHTRIVDEMLDKMSSNLYMRRLLTNDKV